MQKAESGAVTPVFISDTEGKLFDDCRIIDAGDFAAGSIGAVFSRKKLDA